MKSTNNAPNNATDHPGDDILSAFVVGTLAAAKRKRLELHLWDCDRCVDRVTALRQADRALQMAANPAVFAELQAKAAALEGLQAIGRNERFKDMAGRWLHRLGSTMLGAAEWTPQFATARGAEITRTGLPLLRLELSAERPQATLRVKAGRKAQLEVTVPQPKPGQTLMLASMADPAHYDTQPVPKKSGAAARFQAEPGDYVLLLLS